MSNTDRISPFMRQWIRDLDAGVDPTSRLTIRSTHGGALRAVVMALFRRGLTTPDARGLTEDGQRYALSLRVCIRCGCTEIDCSGCISRTGRPCYWVKHNLCSACVPAKATRGKPVRS